MRRSQRAATEINADKLDILITADAMMDRDLRARGQILRATAPLF